MRKKTVLVGLVSLCLGLALAVGVAFAASGAAVTSTSTEATTTSVAAPASPTGTTPAVDTHAPVTTIPTLTTGPILTTEAEIQQAALKYATQAGDPNPTSISYARTTVGRAAEALSGASVNAEQPAVAIVMRGKFTASDAPGEEAPQGTWLSVVVVPTTGEVAEMDVQNHIPNLSDLQLTDVPTS